MAHQREQMAEYLAELEEISAELDLPDDPAPADPPKGLGRRPAGVTATIGFTLDGRLVEVVDDGCTLLEALRDRLGERSPKDGCSPQGQCGCCTVLVDGQARVACVTPLARVAGRSVTHRRRARSGDARSLG